MKKPKIHPAAELFPMMSDSAFAGLLEDIRINGLQEPVAFYRNQLVDGRNRWKACETLGIEPDILELDDDVDPVKFVLSHNLHRRHLNEAQLAMVGDKTRDYYDSQAKERMAAGHNQHTSPMENVPQGSAGTARDKAGEAVGVSGKSIDAARAIRKSGCEELVAMVESGQMSLNAAKQFIKVEPSKTEQAKACKQGPDAVKEFVKKSKPAAKPKNTPKPKPAAEPVDEPEDVNEAPSVDLDRIAVDALTAAPNKVFVIKCVLSHIDMPLLIALRELLDERIAALS